MTVLAKVNNTGTSGATVTTTNTGFDAVVVDTNHLTLTSTGARSGGLQTSVAPVTAAIYGEWNTTVGTKTAYSARCTITTPASAPASSKIFFRALNAGAICYSLAFSSGVTRIVVRDSLNNAIFTDTTAFPFPTGGTRFGISWSVVHNGTAGTIDITIWPDDTYTGTPVHVVPTITFTAAGNGTQATQYRFGMIDTSGPTFAMDDQAVATTIGDLVPFASASTGAPAIGSVSTVGVAGALSQTGSAAITSTSVVAVNTSTAVTAAPAITSSSSVGVTGAATQTGAPAIASVSAVGVQPKTPIWSFWKDPSLSIYNRVIGHRNAEVDFPEMTRFGTQQCLVVYGLKAVNYDAWQCSTGEWVASHDQNTLRVYGVSMDIPTSSWTSLSTLTTIVGGYPIEKLADIMAYAQSIRPDVQLVIENKQGGNTTVRTSFDSTVAGAVTNSATCCVYKAYYLDTGAALAKSSGAFGLSLGYKFAADGAWTSADLTGWDQAMFDYTGSAPDWATSLTNAGAVAKLMLAHVTMSAANAATAFGLGAQGLMAAKIVGVIPNSPAAITSISTVGVTGTVSQAAAVAVTSASTVGVAGIATQSTSVAVASTSTVTVAGRQDPNAAPAVRSVSVVAVAGTLTYLAAVAVSSTSIVGVNTSSQSSGSPAVASVSTVTVVGLIVTASSIAVVSASVVNVSASAISTGAPAISSASVVAVTGSVTRTGAVSVISVSTVGVTGQVKVTTTLAVVSTSTINVGPAGTITGSAAIRSVSFVAVAGFVPSSNLHPVTGQQSGRVPANVTGRTSAARTVSGGTT